MILSQLFQNPLTFYGNFKYHSTAVLEIRAADKQALGHGAGYQLNRAVMAKAQPFRGISNGYLCVLWRPCHLKQQLMLLGMQVNLIRSLLAESQKASQLISKFSQNL